MATLQLEDYLPTLEETHPAGEGRPLRLSVDHIDEDPGQPRQEFDADALSELTASIGTRGVLQPVSVRPNPGSQGRYILNFGARRLRASCLAGKSEIPAFVDEMASGYDQVIENEHREGLSPLEIALFVRARLGLGESQADIARRLGKSRSFVTYATALIDAPDWLMNAYRDGRCRGPRELHGLRQLHAEDAAVAKTLLASGVAVTREILSAARSNNDQGRTAATGAPAAAGGFAPAPAPAPSVARSEPIPTFRRRTTLLAELDGIRVEIVTDDVPPGVGEVYVRFEDGARRQLPAGRLMLTGIVRR